MIKHLALLALAVAIIIASIVGWNIYAEKGRIAALEASKAEMNLLAEKEQSERALNERRAAEAKAQAAKEEKAIVSEKRLLKDAEAKDANFRAEEAKENARLEEAKLELARINRAQEADKLKSLKQESEKKKLELQILEREESKKKHEASILQAKAKLTDEILNDLAAKNTEYEKRDKALKEREAELEAMIEANRPERTVRDLITTDIEEASPSVSADNQDIPEGEARLNEAEKALRRKEIENRDSVNEEIETRLGVLMDKAAQDHDVIGRDYYLKMIKGVK